MSTKCRQSVPLEGYFSSLYKMRKHFFRKTGRKKKGKKRIYPELSILSFSFFFFSLIRV
ncbi:hypothetical protein BDZ91DRAFT_11050 [Kalaharituber pfeilii]|nr:hypothetical protein BDZ91DRAFT_11050 [Kalaharituber pfeilii]